MANKFFPKFFSGEFAEGPIETGRTHGIEIETIIEKYFSNRNEILSLLRIYTNLSLSDLANQLNISETELEEIEHGKDIVPFQWVPKLAKIFKVDLSMLLLLLGHRKEVKKTDTTMDLEDLPMAAQYSGPELTVQEKLDLKELFQLILQNVKNKNQDG